MMTLPHTTAAQPGRNLALIAIFAAFIAACSLLPAIPVGPVAVPITLQTLAVYTVALILGARRAGLSVALYLLAGLLGLPVFAGGSGGFGVLASPSFGYLLGFVPGAFIAGFLAYRFLGPSRSKAVTALGLAVSALAGFAVIQVFGVAGMMVNAHLDLGTALAAAMIYVPGDLIKCAVAVAIALSVHRAFPALAGSGR
ncbi:biotin transporter BioY [Rothia sp. P4278]|uniref:biotin transporter BioY n=1 Tax=Rothia sp. P4278 TaxID=3402658 RepID=UPI003ADF36CB